MPGYTNMAWPEDPYGTGQLWRREPPLLTAFAVLWSARAGRVFPAAYAVAYLRLHRTQPVDLTSGVGFGFRAVTAVTDDEVPELVRLFDLDALRARRLAKIVAGYCLARDLNRVSALAVGDVGRGLRGLADACAAAGEDRPGLAEVLDLGKHEGGDGPDLATAAASAGVDGTSVTRAFEPQSKIDAIVDHTAASDEAAEDRAWRADWLAACSVELALVCAVTAGRILDRHTWEEALDIGAIMEANAWDCFASPRY